MCECCDYLAKGKDLAAVLHCELQRLALLAKGDKARCASIVGYMRGLFFRADHPIRCHAHVYVTSLYDECFVRRQLSSSKEGSQFCDPNWFPLLRMLGKRACGAAKYLRSPINKGDCPRMLVDWPLTGIT